MQKRRARATPWYTKARVYVAVIVPEAGRRAIDDWGFLALANGRTKAPLFSRGDYTIDITL